MRWELLTPPDFRKLAKEEQICVLPLGSLERHGDHLPLGTDGMTVHHLSVKAAELEPCVVFPPFWFGQVHEASCFTGTVALPSHLTLQLFDALLDQIAHNGFKKIVVVNGHGGNSAFLSYYAMSNLEKRKPYTLYIINSAANVGDRRKALDDLIETSPTGHACEYETSVMMAIAPDAVKLEYQQIEEPILPKKRLAHLKGVTSGLWWYADYPYQVLGCPHAASREKGEKFVDAMVQDLADTFKKIKEDTEMARLKEEFLAGYEATERGE